MRPNEPEKLLRAILKWQPKSIKEQEDLSRYTQYMIKRKKKIQMLQVHSIPNQIYIFPRQRPNSQSSASSISESQFECIKPTSYDLRTQNKINKNYQHSSLHFRYGSVQNVLTGKDKSSQKLDLLNLQKKVKRLGSSNHKTKKRHKNEQKTALNSSKKLIIAEQYSLGTHPNNIHTKKCSEAVTMSYREKPPRGRTKTQL